MTTRQTIQQDPTTNQSHMPTGYDDTEGLVNDYHIPSCGLTDVDEAVFNLFEKEIGYTPREIKGKQNFLQLNKPFVVFAGGERFASVKRLRPMKDTNGALILPAIAIRRTGIEQTDEDITGRGINQMTGNIVVKRRLNSKDRSYQNFLNKYSLQNTENADNSRREKDGSSLAAKQGMLLQPDVANNIFEIITIPSPQYYTANYEIVFWTIHRRHMNYMIETMFANFLPQRRGFVVTTEKGYWFVADVDESFNNDGNEEDYTEDKRIVRYTFTMKVKAYIVAPDAPGNASPIKSYVSAPQISFDVFEGQDVQSKKHLNEAVKEPFTLSEIQPDIHTSQQMTSLNKRSIAKDVIDPVTGEKQISYVELVNTPRRQGETIYTAPDIATLDSFLLSINKTR